MRVSARTVALLGAIALGIANLGRLPAGALAGRNAPFTLADLIAGLVWLAIVVALLTRRTRIVMDGVTSAAVTFVAIAVVSTILAVQRYRLGIDDGFEVFAFLARWVLYFGWYPFVAWCLTADQAEEADRWTNNALLAICAFGILQAFFIPEFGTRIAGLGFSPSWEYQGNRLVSTLLDPNFAGAMALLALLRAVAGVAEGERVSPLALVVPAAAIVLSASRSSILAFGVGLVVIVIARGLNLRLLKTIGVGVLAVLAFLPVIVDYGSSLNKLSVDASAAQRFVTWTRAYTLFVEHPWFGIGFNAAKQAQEARGWIFIGGADTGFDGGLFFVMVMTGVIGAGWYAVMLARGVLASRRVWRDDSLGTRDRAHATAAAASVIAILAHSLFSNSLLLPFVMQVLWVRFGLLAHISAVRRRRLGLAAVVPIALAVTSCSPCAGMFACESDYVFRITGSIRHYADGAPVKGARVDVTFNAPDGPVQRSAITTSDGLWSVAADGTCCDAVSAQAVVDAPGEPAYLTPTISVQGSRVAGNALVLDPWLDKPSSRFAFILIGPNNAPLEGATLTFQRTDGVPMTIVSSDTFSDGIGAFHLDLVSDRVGDVIGTITVNHPSLSTPWRREGIPVALDYRYRLPGVITMRVGSGLGP